MSESGSIERILVMGAGPGGDGGGGRPLRAAAIRVHLYNRSPKNAWRPSWRTGRRRCIEGDLVGGDEAEELAPLALITTDIAAAMENVELILIAVPAYGQRAMLEACLPYLRGGQIILLLTGSAGSLELAPLLRDAGHSLDEVLLGETVTLPQSARMVGPASCASACPPTCVSPPSPAATPKRCMERLGDTLRLIPQAQRARPRPEQPQLHDPPRADAAELRRRRAPGRLPLHHERGHDARRAASAGRRRRGEDGAAARAGAGRRLYR